MWWLNAGVAPPYVNYVLAVQLRSANGSAVINVPVDVRKWLPGDAVFDGNLYVPETLSEGVYDFRVAMSCSLARWYGRAQPILYASSGENKRKDQRRK